MGHAAREARRAESGLGGSLGWLSAFDTSLAPPHSSWSTASEEDKVAWVPAPGLRVSANRSDAAGWFRSSVTAAAALFVCTVDKTT